LTNSISHVVGIDLGTTRSVVAALDKRGIPYTIVNREGDLTTPSAVLFEDDCVTVGKEALKAQLLLPDKVATFIKREIGKQEYSRPLDGQRYPPDMILSLIIGRLKSDAEAKLGCAVTKAVITVPAYFNEPKRRATIDAAMLAGVEVIGVINEPTAAAIAYGLEKHVRLMGPQTVLIYDLGGGTFDISIVRVEEKSIEVVATDGNAMLGGLDWDKCLIKWLDDLFAKQNKIRPSETAVGQVMLQQEAETLKHSLSVRKTVKFRIAYERNVLQAEITRDEFEEQTAHLLDRTRFTVAKLLTETGKKWSGIDQIILVGGSTRMPQVSAMLNKESGIEPNLTVSPDEAVAHGAAIYAQTVIETQLKSATKLGMSITDVNAHNLCVLGVDCQTGMKTNFTMIARNSPIPSKQTTRFETLHDNQQSVAVEIIEGGDVRGRHGTKIGRCVLRDLPKGLPAGTSVDVTFEYDRDGLIHVQALLPKTGQKTKISIKRQSGHDESELKALKEIYDALSLDSD
jgi:molecular chaperone DnaK